MITLYKFTLIYLKKKKQMFYGMGHFSKYVPENSVRIDLTITSGADLIGTAFLRPDGKRSVVILNL